MTRGQTKLVLLLCLCGFGPGLSAGCKRDAAEAPRTETAAAKPAPAKPAPAKPGGVRPAAKGLDADGQMQLSDGDRCPVCAMTVTKHRRFASAIETTGGKAYYFCGTGCLIKSWRHPEVFLGVPRSQLKRAVTREYFGGVTVDATKARWVAGSDVVGPMGPALVPLKDEADVKTFKRRHGGKVVFSLGELTDARWKAITGKEATGWPPNKKIKQR